MTRPQTYSTHFSWDCMHVVCCMKVSNFGHIYVTRYVYSCSNYRKEIYPKFHKKKQIKYTVLISLNKLNRKSLIFIPYLLILWVFFITENV